MNTNADIIKIENVAFDLLMESGVSENVFTSSRPKAYTEMDDLVVARVSGSSADLKAISKSALSIEIYARNIGVLRDSKRLSQMWEEVVEAIHGNKNPYYFDYLNTTPTIDDGNGFNYMIVNFTLIIK